MVFGDTLGLFHGTFVGELWTLLGLRRSAGVARFASTAARASLVRKKVPSACDLRISCELRVARTALRSVGGGLDEDFCSLSATEGRAEDPGLGSQCAGRGLRGLADLTSSCPTVCLSVMMSTLPSDES